MEDPCSSSRETSLVILANFIDRRFNQDNTESALASPRFSIDDVKN